MTSSSAAGRPDRSSPWRWPVDPGRYDTAPLLRVAEKDAVIELGTGNLRRLARHDPATRGWQQVRRLLRPLDDAAAALEALPPRSAAGRCWTQPRLESLKGKNRT